MFSGLSLLRHSYDCHLIELQPLMCLFPSEPSGCQTSFASLPRCLFASAVGVAVAIAVAVAVAVAVLQQRSLLRRARAHLPCCPRLRRTILEEPETVHITIRDTRRLFLLARSSAFTRDETGDRSLRHDWFRLPTRSVFRFETQRTPRYPRCACSCWLMLP